MDLFAFLAHGDALPILYGVTIFFGLCVMLIKLRYGLFVSAAIDVVVFVLVFKLHGGSMSGAFAATIAALLAGLVFPLILRRW